MKDEFKGQLVKGLRDDTVDTKIHECMNKSMLDNLFNSTD